MSITEIFNDIKELFNKYKIGNVVQEPLSISGGLMHKMFQVTTETNIYAVKWLNPSIMQRNGVMQNMINSELIANAFSKHLPVIAALNIDGQNVLHSNNKYYMVFHWIEGTSIFPPLISEKHCYKIGNSLGKIHRLNITIPEVKKNNNDSIIYNWQQYLVKGKELNTFWIDTYAKMVDKLIYWNTLINESKYKLSEFMVISHGDLDPKNVMWYQDMPYFIDWEAAGYVNPYQELLEVLNYWANNGNGELDKVKFKILLNAYNEYMSTKTADWDCVLNSGYAGMLGWLEYNLKRALGIESSDEEENELGAEQVIGTIKELERYDNQLIILKKWLSE
ncbi:phosphotransferase [Anaerocolumna sedimenticola]|uniref:Phosphotransferase n=1 Tax=Anaerocolumna sedimenticola TaxID=2696063 RepID=A0A6P1TRU6_9FIRM|nr:phosphotransferase [Anaerocolumna sedimenticola]QHQ62972.1 phosphotransferase [Anaerocolumna sedimenticola]